MSTKKIEESESTKERATFSLDVDVKDKLELTWLQLRRMLKGQGISKSGIVETALKMALEDFKNKKKSSKLYKILDQS